MLDKRGPSKPAWKLSEPFYHRRKFWGPFYQHRLNGTQYGLVITVWISNYVLDIVCDEITYSLLERLHR